MLVVSHPRWLRTLLSPLAYFYGQFMRVRAALYARGTLRPRRLPVKVVSVGNLTVGGTGKTPLVLWLAQRLGARGVKVAVLTRGYGRLLRAPRIVLDSTVNVEEAGDEPVLLARRLPGIPLGIAADRFAVGRRVAEKFRPDIFLLDDGFQHLRLARDLDIVLLDSSDPFGGGYVLPAGRLREPVAALARADLVVLTRLRNGAERVIEAIRLYNPRVPVFGARTRLREVLDATTHKPVSRTGLARVPVLAFCGIGNEAAFWQDLREWGFHLVGTLAFPDHHRYRIQDFSRIVRAADRAGAQAVLTTEKDVVNFTVLPPSIPPCFYCRIELEFDDEEGFWNALAAGLSFPAAAPRRRETPYVN
ncbi:MAG: tetraacyldisaccharide 4'-kinase [Acidobacteria bacterium]|nr:tetraacyldisaccharide 4'-kinase [Acidobacteriota bacterium]